MNEKLAHFERLLYPQYRQDYTELSEDMWKYLQDKAKRLLNESTFVDDRVKAHWESICAGIIPFGFILRKGK